LVKLLLQKTKIQYSAQNRYLYENGIKVVVERTEEKRTFVRPTSRWLKRTNSNRLGGYILD
jgi:hypothetical protein